MISLNYFDFGDFVDGIHPIELAIKGITDTASPDSYHCPFRSPEFTSGFKWGSCCSIFSFMCSVLRHMNPSKNRG